MKHQINLYHLDQRKRKEKIYMECKKNSAMESGATQINFEAILVKMMEANIALLQLVISELKNKQEFNQ